MKVSVPNNPYETMMKHNRTKLRMRAAELLCEQAFAQMAVGEYDIAAIIMQSAVLLGSRRACLNLRDYHRDENHVLKSLYYSLLLGLLEINGIGDFP